MKKSRWSRILTAGIVFALLVTVLPGCSDSRETATIDAMEAEPSNSISFDIIGGKDVMPIAAFYGPYISPYSEDGQNTPDYLEEEYWADMAACGVNLVTYSKMDYTQTPLLIKKNLDMGEKYNIAVVVGDEKIRNMGVDSEINMEELATRLSEYINHPACAGVYIVDEPYTSFFDPMPSVPERDLYRYEKISKVLGNEFDIYTYENLLSSGTRPDLYERYEDYVREYCKVLEPKNLLYDRYIFDKEQDGYVDRYFYDLAIVRMVAQDNNIPFWTYIQAGSQWNDAAEHFDSDGYWPDEGEFDWNINTCLAFGAQGLSYFPYIQPYYFAYAKSEPFDFERNGLIGAWGNKNRWYYYAQDAMKQIQAVDEVLMNSVNKGVLACGEEAVNDLKLTKDYNVLLGGTSWRELKSVKGDALIGCFNYQGKTALYVVNYSRDYAQKLELAFWEPYDVTVIQDGETRELHGDGMILNLLAGDAALLVFE